ncbi:MAG: transglutaminase-like domain-containing protein [Limisphaerales bacterium]
MRLLVSILCLATLPAFAQQIVRTNDNFNFEYKVTIPPIKQSGRIWIPLARSDTHQTVVAKPDSPVKLKRLVESRFGNRILFGKLHPQDSGKKITIRYRVNRRENTGTKQRGKLDEFLKTSRLVPLNSELKELARKASAKGKNAEEKGNLLYWHTLDRMRYDKSGTGWGYGDAVYACDSRTGNCTDFHSYFIALARAEKIPARFSIGFTIPAGQDEGKIGGYHCWAEFHAADRWIPIDISEADKHPALKDYYLGRHPANRFQLTQGRDLVADPLPKSGPINFLVYPVMEVDGEEVRAECSFRFQR